MRCLCFNIFMNFAKSPAKSFARALGTRVRRPQGGEELDSMTAMTQNSILTGTNLHLWSWFVLHLCFISEAAQDFCDHETQHPLGRRVATVSGESIGGSQQALVR